MRHQCGPGSIPRLGAICGLSLLVLYSAPRGFLRVLRFPLSSKIKVMFKVKHKLPPKNILDLFSETPSKYHLRNSDFYIPRFNSVRHGKHSLTFFGPRLWSKLSPGDRERQTLTAFMANIRKRDLASLVENDFCNGNCPTCTC